MRKSIIVSSVMIMSLVFGAQMGCGPNCAKVIVKKSGDDLNYEDGVRINDFVKRRASSMKLAEGGNMYAVEEAKNTVIACEYAIQMMVQVRNLYQAKSKLYDENLAAINDTRCALDEALASKGKLIGAGKAAFLTTGTCSDIQMRYEKLQALLKGEGTASDYEITTIYQKGVKAKKKGAKDKSDDKPASSGTGPENEDIVAPSGGEGGGAETGGAETGGAETGSGEGGDKGGAGGMDSF